MHGKQRAPDTAFPAPEVPAASPSLPPSVAERPLLLDGEKLDLYRVAVEFQTLAAQLLPRGGQSGLRDQLNRASVSIVLNIAEGAGRFSPADKARFYAMARGSATECAAILDLLCGRGLLAASVYGRGRGLLVRTVQMLTKLNTRLSA